MRRWFRRSWPLSGDWCAICHVDLLKGKVWELRTDPQSAEDGVGGTYLSATYCRRHRPKDAIRN